MSSDLQHIGLDIGSFFKQKNISSVFTLCGGHISPILVGCEKENIDIIQVRDEVSAVFAADAVSRLTDSVGVAIVTAGPGVTNTITAIKNAQMAQSPVLLIGGAAATLLKGRGSLQDIDQISLLKTYVKSAVSVKKTRDVVPTLANALNTAISGVPGPVFVELPIDLLYPEEDIRKEFMNQLPKSGFFGKIAHWYVNRHLNDLFSSKKSSVKIKPVKEFKLDQRKIDKAALAIVKAKKPVFLLGNQVTQNKEFLPMCLKSIDKLSVPTFTSGMARGCFGSSDKYFFRHNRKHALKNADVVVTLGIPLDFRLGYGFSIGKDATLISINKSKEDLNKNRKPDIGMHADPSRIMHEIGKIINPPSCQNWIEELIKLEKNRENEIQQFSEHKTDFVNPVHLCKTIDKFIDEESILVADGGDFVGTASYTIRPRSPLGWLDPGPFGTLGVGGGFAIGAKTSFPKKEVWVFYGDGASAYSLAEFDTLCRHKLPVIAIIGNDASWQQIAREQKQMLGSNIGTELAFNAYEKVVEGYGGKGYYVENHDTLDETLKRAKEDAKLGYPVLVNIKISKSDFRKGSISV
ncbi:thiamine pyrophosphate-binding protein [Candidatus Marinimicrobia bacterium]|nr:thiamine pyrophosphate-binding protein [Candidatus Neomarinimicrobiota bacterium]MDA9735949.1 thiamine pyrophosphate-binding protein [Candidatus Neomarinimicrobiota bacterium]